MSKNDPKQNIRYEVIVQEDPETGDLFLPLPSELLRKLKWKENDEIDWSKDDRGYYILTKKSK